MTNNDTPPSAGYPAPGAEDALSSLKGVADILSALAESAVNSHIVPEALAFLASSVATIRETLQAEFDARHAPKATPTGGNYE